MIGFQGLVAYVQGNPVGSDHFSLWGGIVVLAFFVVLAHKAWKENNA